MNSCSSFFSVIVPCHNAENSIAKTLESLLIQTFPKFEVIVVFDGCTDQSEEVVNSFKPRFEENNILLKTKSLEKNCGPARARNLGWEMAHGLYVTFLDSDDSFLPEKLGIIHNNLKALGFPIILGHRAKTSSTEQSSGEVIRLSFTDFLICNRIFTPCLTVLRSYQGRFNENMRYCEDYDFLLRASYGNKVYMLDKALTELGHPPNTESGLSSSILQMRLGEWRSYINLIKINPLFIFLIPALLMYSIGKHIRLVLKRSLFRH